MLTVSNSTSDMPSTPLRSAGSHVAHVSPLSTPTGQRVGDKSSSHWNSSGSGSGVEDGVSYESAGHNGSVSAHQKRFRAQTRNVSGSKSNGSTKRGPSTMTPESTGTHIVRGLLAAANSSQNKGACWPDSRVLPFGGNGSSAGSLNSSVVSDPRFFLHAKTPESMRKNGSSSQLVCGTGSTRVGTHLTTPGSSHHTLADLHGGVPSDSAVGAVRRALDQWFGVSSSGSDSGAGGSGQLLGSSRSHLINEAVLAAGGVAALAGGDPAGNWPPASLMGGANTVRGERASASPPSSVAGACSGTSVSCRSFCRGASCEPSTKSTDPSKHAVGSSQTHAKSSDISLSGLSSSQGTVSSTKRSTHQSTSGPKVATDSIVPTSEAGSLPLYRGPDPLPTCLYRRLYDPLGPVMFSFPPLQGAQHARAEIRLWPRDVDRVISQNSSKRKVHRAVWLSPVEPKIAFPVALKFVEDGNIRDGRSIKREIECHLYIYQRLAQLMAGKTYNRLEDAWPCAEMFGYYLDKKNPGMSVLVTRKLSGPDFFDVIRTEHTSTFNARTALLYEQHKLQWCLLAMERIAQYGRLGIRHNDIKPDNIVLDFYATPDSNERLLDVKLIDLGTASMQHAKDFTGGTSWYESPEQKVLEFHTKKQRNLEAAKQIDIGLPSDAWGAGLSITEVLMGRRVVDVMKPPLGPGPLDFRGTEGWAVEPKDWVHCARQALGLDREHQRFPLCAEAARLVFSMLVRPKPSMRATVEDVLPHLRLFADEATFQAMRKYHDSAPGCDTSGNSMRASGISTFSHQP